MFHVTKQVDYGLLLVSSLAKKATKGPISLRSVSNDCHLPYRFLQKIAIPLRKAKIIVSQEGVTGGFMLAREAKKISVGEVVKALESTEPVACLHGECVLSKKCTARKAWQKIHQVIESTMDKISIADLI